MKPEIIIGGDTVGQHAKELAATRRRLKAGKQYIDLSTVRVLPTRGTVPIRVMEALENLQTPMNNAFVRVNVSGMEVGDAYCQAVDIIKTHLPQFRFMLTVEEDNLPPSDGLLKLYENICTCKVLCSDHYAIVAGLYFTKGPGGQPMIYGDPSGAFGYQPQVPRTDQIQECNGTGMGFTLWRLDVFEHIAKPYFETATGYTQDLYCMKKVREAGYRIASDNRVKVGHLDVNTGEVW